MRVKDICTLQNGRAFKPEEWGLEGLPIVRIQNLNDETAPFNYYSGEYSQTHEINNGDLLFSWSGTPGTSFGAFRWYRGKGVLNQHIFKVLPKIDVDLDYLKYALNGNIDSIIAKAHGGVGLQHITKKELDEIEIPILPKEKQISVVGILQQVDAIIIKRKQQLSALDDIIKARFVEMFDGGDYPQATIADLVAEKVSSVKKDFAQDDTIKYIDISSIDNQRNIMTGYTEYILSEAPSRAQQHIIEGDILISTVRPNLRNVAMTTYTDDNLVASSGFCVLRASKCLPSYLMAIVCSDEFTGAMSRVVTGANYPAIKDSDVLSYVVSVPPMGKQLEFEAFTTQIDKSKSVIQKSLDETQLLFDSLMQKYFGYEGEEGHPNG